MFGLIGHSTSFDDARRKAMELGYEHIAKGDLDVADETCTSGEEPWDGLDESLGFDSEGIDQ